MKHSSVRLLLYEYVCRELPENEMAGVAGHLVSCETCSLEADEIRAIVNLPASGFSRASDQRSPEFWNAFPASVERRIQSAIPLRDRKPIDLFDAVSAFFTLRPHAIAVIGGGLALVVLALFLPAIFRVRSEQTIRGEHVAEEPVQAVTFDNRVGDYFRKSKVLLVGLTHLETDDDQPIDLSRESDVSRELLVEARYLRNQPLDIRSARLIDDLQKILIELAHIKEHDGLPNVDIIRSGIHRENLLFKIRMAEASCDTTRVIPVRDTY